VRVACALHSSFFVSKSLSPPLAGSLLLVEYVNPILSSSGINSPTRGPLSDTPSRPYKCVGTPIAPSYPPHLIPPSPTTQRKVRSPATNFPLLPLPSNTATSPSRFLGSPDYRSKPSFFITLPTPPSFNGGSLLFLTMTHRLL